MDNAFVTPEVLAEYLSLPVEVIEDFSSSGIITQDCYFEIGEHRRYLISKVTDALFEYTKKNYRDNVKKNKNDEKNKEKSEDSCERLMFALHLLEGLTYSLAKYIDNIHVKFEELVSIIWDSDFNNSINAWKVEIESVLQISDIHGDVKRNLSVVISEIEEFEQI
jgi:methionine salvage enolase-phosphatase E1